MPRTKNKDLKQFPLMITKTLLKQARIHAQDKCISVSCYIRFAIKEKIAAELTQVE